MSELVMKHVCEICDEEIPEGQAYLVQGVRLEKPWERSIESARHTIDYQARWNKSPLSQEELEYKVTQWKNNQSIRPEYQGKLRVQKNGSSNTRKLYHRKCIDIAIERAYDMAHTRVL